MWGGGGGEGGGEEWKMLRERESAHHFPSVSSAISSFSSAPLLLPFIRVPTFPQAESNQYFGKVRGRSTHACGSRHRRCTLRKFNRTALLSETRVLGREHRAQALCF